MASTSSSCVRAQSYILVIFSLVDWGHCTISGCPVQPLPDQVLPSASFNTPVSVLQHEVNLLFSAPTVP